LLTQELSAAPRGGNSGSAAILSGTAGEGCLENEPPRRNTIEPYTATRKTTRVQKLANGTTITQETISKEARDSSWRSYRENKPEYSGGIEAPHPADTFYFVFDPVSRTSLNWNSRSKEATLVHMAEPGQARTAHLPQVTLPDRAAAGSAPMVRPDQPKQQTEQLGTKNINGLEARGMRTTRIIPVGQMGNDQPLVITHEHWFSQELGIIVLQIDDDPRTGTRTEEVTDVEQGEPDPALFQAPEGYTVKEQFPGQQN